MSFSPENSAVKIAPGSDLEKAINSATSAEAIISLMREAMVDQRLVTVDGFNPDVLYRNETPAPTGFSKTVIVNDIKVVLEGATEQEVLAKENLMLREIGKQRPAGEHQRDENGRFAAEQQPVVRSGAESADAVIASVTDKSLRDLGIDPDVMREATAAKFTQSWEDAGNEFLRSHSDWPGTDANKDTLGRLVAENNLLDAEDKAAALSAAWEHMKANNLVVENPEVTERQSYEQEISECTTQAELDAVTARYFPGSRAAQSNRQMYDR